MKELFFLHNFSCFNNNLMKEGTFMDTKKVGKSIAFLRNFYGMTQKELAEKLGVTDKAVSRWERGIGSPDISLLTKLSIILDVDIESILEGNITHLELNWKGILALKYPKDMKADTQMFGKRLLYFQLSFFLLVGITEVCMRGLEEDILFAQKSLGSGESLGISLSYDVVLSKEELTHNEKSKIFQNYNKEDGVLLVEGIDFLYGKDVTRSFRRVMSASRDPVKLTSFCKRSTSISFWPKMSGLNIDIDGNQVTYCALERGIITFSILKEEDLLDAAILLKIIESHQEEKIADLKEISERRGLIKR